MTDSVPTKGELNDADELLRRMMRLPLPLAPDRPRGFNPVTVAEDVEGANVIFGRLPTGDRILLYAVVGGKDVSIEELFSGGVPGDTPTISVRCEDDEDVGLLRQLIQRVKRGAEGDGT